jgi:hypothetical protein
MKTTIMCKVQLFSLFFFLLSMSAVAYPVKTLAPGREFYEIKVYHLKDKAQEDRVDTYLQQAFLPAVHRAGIKQVCVFKPVGNDTAADRRIYVFIPFNSLNEYAGLSAKLFKDKEYNTSGSDYLDAPYNNPPYIRMESIQCEAFPDMPRMQLPKLKGPMGQRIYELRSYESPTERYHISKVKMFNEGGEVKLFKRLNFNAVFYSRVIAGCRMPNLMYMTTFENKADRDEHWKAFIDSPEWKVLTGLAEYKNNVSRNETILMTPVEYSDF